MLGPYRNYQASSQWDIDDLNIEAALERARRTVAYAHEVHRSVAESRKRAAALRQEAKDWRALSAKATAPRLMSRTTGRAKIC